MSDTLPLSRVFMSHWPGASTEHHPALPALETCLQELYLQGLSFWEGVEVAGSDFIEYLAARTPVGPNPAQSLASVNTRDLYLACACARGHSRALASFDSAILVRVPAFIAKIDASSSFADEVRQVLRERFLCASLGEAPAITRYSGSGELTNWVRVAAVRTALGLRRNRDDRPAMNVDDATLKALPMSASPEADNIRAGCQKEFKNALAEAFSSLSTEQRNVLRLHFASRLTGDQIAGLLGIGRATVVRWIANARGHLMRETHRLLRKRLRLTRVEMDSFIQAALSQLDMSLTSLLCERPTDGDMRK